jgi:hypothetical protein
VSTSTPGIRRLCIAVDLEGYSRRDNLSQLSAQSELVQVLEQACTKAQLERTYWEKQPQGDGELALLPSGVDETRVIPDFVHELGIPERRRSSPRPRELTRSSGRLV